MPVEESSTLADEGINRELITLDITLSAKVGRTALTIEEYIRVRQAQGATLAVIKADLLKDLDEGGRIFGEFLNAIKPTFAGSTHRFRDIGVLAETGAKLKYRWAAVLVNTCPDCLDRHNKVKLWEDWEEDGLPRTGATVCKENCKCVLLPARVTELEPIFRRK